MNDPLIGIVAGVQVNFSVADCLVAGLHPFGMFDDSADPAVLRILHSRGNLSARVR
jgi:hypothetical protein